MNILHLFIITTWILTLILTFVFVRRRNPNRESVFTKLFTSNQELDTTLGILLRGAVVFAVLAIVVVFFSMFHDDLSENDVGMLAMHVIGMATNAITLVSVVNGHGEKKKEEEAPSNGNRNGSNKTPSGQNH